MCPAGPRQRACAPRADDGRCGRAVQTTLGNRVDPSSTGRASACPRRSRDPAPTTATSDWWSRDRSRRRRRRTLPSPCSGRVRRSLQAAIRVPGARPMASVEGSARSTGGAREARRRRKGGGLREGSRRAPAISASAASRFSRMPARAAQRRPCRFHAWLEGSLCRARSPAHRRLRTLAGGSEARRQRARASVSARGAPQVRSPRDTCALLQRRSGAPWRTRAKASGGAACGACETHRERRCVELEAAGSSETVRNLSRGPPGDRQEAHLAHSEDGGKGGAAAARGGHPREKRDAALAEIAGALRDPSRSPAALSRVFRASRAPPVLRALPSTRPWVAPRNSDGRPARDRRTRPEQGEGSVRRLRRRDRSRDHQFAGSRRGAGSRERRGQATSPSVDEGSTLCRASSRTRDGTSHRRARGAQARCRGPAGHIASLNDSWPLERRSGDEAAFALPLRGRREQHGSLRSRRPERYAGRGERRHPAHAQGSRRGTARDPRAASGHHGSRLFRRCAEAGDKEAGPPSRAGSAPAPQQPTAAALAYGLDKRSRAPRRLRPRRRHLRHLHPQLVEGCRG